MQRTFPWLLLATLGPVMAQLHTVRTPGGRSLFVITDRESEFRRLGRMSLDGATFDPIASPRP